jgi:hypothetical protein
LGEWADRRDWSAVERRLVALIALHSMCVGTILVFFPGFACRMAGWGDVSPDFFPRQGGAFHFAVAFGYLHEQYRHRGVALLLFTKSLATVFLLGIAFLTDVPWAVPFSGVADGLMGMCAFLVHRQASRPQAAG